MDCFHRRQTVYLLLKLAELGRLFLMNTRPTMVAFQIVQRQWFGGFARAAAAAGFFAAADSNRPRVVAGSATKSTL